MNNIIFKECGDCKKKLPKTMDYFHQQCKNKKGGYILKSICKKCHIKKGAVRINERKKNGTYVYKKPIYKKKIRTDADRLASKIYYENNKEKHKQYREEHKDKMKEYMKNRYENIRRGLVKKKSIKVLNKMLIKRKLENIGFVSLTKHKQKKISIFLDAFLSK